MNTDLWDSSVGKLSASLARDLGLNPVGGLTQVTPMRREEVIICKSHITPVSLTGWHIMILFKKIFKSKILDSSVLEYFVHYFKM